MKIDVLPKRIVVNNYPIQGKRWVICYSDGIAETINDPYKVDKDDYDWENGYSAVFNEKSLAEFQPNKGVHEIMFEAKKALERELKSLQAEVKIKKNQFYTDKKGVKYDMFEKKFERIEFLKNNTIVFVEIDFVG